MALQFLLILVVSVLLVNGDSLKHCTSHITSCCDLRTYSPKDAPNGVYKMSLGTYSYANVYCDMTTSGGGWIVIQRNRNNSNLSFDKNWKEYEDGFGDLTEDFWGGLRLMNSLTHRGQWELRVDFKTDEHTWSYLHYDHFSVGNATVAYPLMIAGYTGNIGDYFTAGSRPLNNTKFSTYDNDNDVWSGSCATNYGSGWWHQKCFNINPNYQPPIINWPAEALFIEMKIRQKGCTMH